MEVKTKQISVVTEKRNGIRILKNRLFQRLNEVAVLRITYDLILMVRLSDLSAISSFTKFTFCFVVPSIHRLQQFIESRTSRSYYSLTLL